VECTSNGIYLHQTVHNIMTWSGNYFANGMLVDNCDTKHTWRAKADKVKPLKFISDKGKRPSSAYASSTPKELAAEVTRVGHDGADGRGSSSRRWLVVITGGEPLEQSDALADLCFCLINSLVPPAMIQIETSGCGVMGRYNNRASYQNKLHFCLSPKVGVGNQDTPLNHMANAFDSIKLPIETVDCIDKFTPYLQRHPSAPVYLQPVDGVEGSLNAAIELAKMYGWQVSCQIHKFLGLR
jgi:organic radical activating enzyme